ncbi:DUF3034 family protein [Phenylobacterium sp.]|uniref:DUF3034 family protein n=1 Tax=Phenylobacterium sp. TaxID=1871053 RepID=UPI0025E0166F|nr:DUF3034 family protein [Phenylobacterium sp.]
MRNLALSTALSLLCAGTAAAEDLRPAGKLLLTGGVTTVEGSAGGGLSSWAFIGGYETRDGVGANVHATYLNLPDYEFRAYGASVGLFDRVEVSYTRQDFDTQATGAKLGLGKGFTFHQDIFGAKLKVLGDAIYNQDSWVPQIAVGAQYKTADKGAVIGLLGGQHDDGVDYYVAATKVLLSESLVLNATLRATKANQTGLLGFGGPGHDRYSLQAEGSAGVLLTKRLLVGGEYRTKPNNLGLKESDWFDLFAAYAVNKNLSVTAAYADLGTIATFKGQRGLYLSLQAGF